ncbi:hypothetical protein D3C71_1288060 [compost metagenome]
MLERRHRRRFAGFISRGVFGDHVIRMDFVERILRAMRGDVMHGAVGKEFECFQLQLLAERREHLHQHFKRRQRQQHHIGGRRRVGQLQRCLDHDAQGAFRADHQLTEVVTAGVLDQAFVEFQQLAVAGHHLQPGHPFAGIAVADHADAAGIGGDVAADGAGTARREVHRVDQTVLACRVVQCFQRHAGLHGQGAVHCIEAECLVHALQAEHQLAVGGHCATGQTRATAGRHHRHRFRIGPAHHRLHLLDRRRQGDGQRRRRPTPGPVAAVMLQVGRIGLQTQAGAGLLQGVQARVGHGECFGGMKARKRASHAARRPAAAPRTCRQISEFR